MFLKLFVLGFLSCAVAAHADLLVMDNGDRITGRLDSITGGKAIFDTPYAGRIWVEIANIRTLETEEAYAVRMGDRMIEGTFAGEGDLQQLIGADQAAIVNWTGVRSATQSRNAFTRFAAGWGSHLDLALSLADGNSSTEAFNVLLEVDYQNELNAHLVTALLAREEGEGLLTRDQLDIDYAYKRFLTERWYGAGNAEYFQDTLKDIDSRITLGIGVGVQFFDNSIQNLSSDIGISAVREDIGGDSDVEPALRLGVDYQRFVLAKTIELFHRQSILQLLGDEKNQVFSSSTGIRYAYNERIDTNFRIDLAYESDPPPGNERTDTTYSLGIGIKF
jgi:putative salt-induced outer membrane protein YdiY